MTRKRFSLVVSTFCFSATMILCWRPSPVSGSGHYTPGQLEAFRSRVGRTYWAVPVNERLPVFLSHPRANAPTFSPQTNESFVITDLIGQNIQNPFYKVKLASGKEGFMRPETFLEEFNLTILTVDPLAGEKEKTKQAAAEENKRLEWIQNRPWPQSVKEAAIKRKVVPGLNTQEVVRILGKPSRVVDVKGQRVPEEHWHYDDGTLLIFHRKLLSRVERTTKP